MKNKIFTVRDQSLRKRLLIINFIFIARSIITIHSFQTTLRIRQQPFPTMKRSTINNNKHYYSSSIISSSSSCSTPRISTIRYNINPNLDLETQPSSSSASSVSSNSTTTILMVNDEINSMIDQKEKERGYENDTVDTGNQITTIPALYSILLLNLVTIIWGTQHAIIKQVIDDDISSSEFTLARFMIALLLVIRYTPPLPSNISMKLKENHDDNSNNVGDFNNVWRWGIELGIWMFLG